MKKLRIFSLLALLLCAVMLLSACGSVKNAKMTSIYREVKPVSDTPRLQTATQLQEDGWNIESFDRNLAVFFDCESEQSVYRVLNMNTGTVVGTYRDSAATENEAEIKTEHEITLYTLSEFPEPVSYYIVSAKTTFGIDETYKTTLYAQNGTKVAEAAQQITPSRASDLILFDETCYRIDDNGDIAALCAWGRLAGDLPDVVYGGKNAYVANLPTSDGFSILNPKNLDTIAIYHFPGYAEQGSFFPLMGGDVLVQYLLRLSDDAAQYDLLLGTGTLKKYSLVQKRVSCKNGEVTDLKANYFYSSVMPRDAIGKEGEQLSRGIENIAGGVSVADKRLSSARGDILVLSLGNDAKVKSVLNRSFVGMVDPPSIVADGVFSVTDAQGRRLLYSKSGKQIGEITGAEWLTDTYVVTERAIYDFQLNKLCDFAEEGYELALNNAGYKFRSGVLLCKQDEWGKREYYLYNGAVTKIASGNTQSFFYISDRMYLIRDSAERTYTYCNDWGETLLQTGEESFSVCTDTENPAYIMSYYNYDTGKNVYYLFR